MDAEEEDYEVVDQEGEEEEEWEEEEEEEEEEEAPIPLSSAPTAAALMATVTNKVEDHPQTEGIAQPQPTLLNIPLKEISLGTRARKQYDDLMILAQDFKVRGVISPIAVKRQSGDKPYLLLAGGRRFAAANLATLETIPARVYEENLTELDVREIELMENLRRKDLSWTESTWLTEEIHRLWVARYGEATGPSEGHSAADTAKLLNVSPMSVSRDRQLAKALSEHGQALAKAKNKSEALRIVKQLEKRKQDAAAAAKFEALQTDDDVTRKKQQLVNGYIPGDFFLEAKKIPDKSVSFCEVDPPYAIDLNKVKLTHMADSTEYQEVPAESYPSFLRELYRVCYEKMMSGGWLVAWCAWQWLGETQKALEDAGFKVCPIPGIWTKLNTQGQTLQPELRLASTSEPFLYACKGTGFINKQGRSNVFSYAVVPTQTKDHTTERPVALITEVISTFQRQGGKILIPFLGSGNSLLAANNNGCVGFGYEINADLYRASYIRKVSDGTLYKYA